MKGAVILGAVRTPIGAFSGGLKDVPAHALGSHVIRAALERSGVAAADVDEVILGNVLQAGQGQGPGRQAALNAGIPETVPAWAINQLCGSGLKTVCMAATMVSAGEAQCVVAGGMENMSQSPYLVPSMRSGAKMGHQQAMDSMIIDGLTDAFSKDHMGLTAEALAEKYSISREDQDRFAAESQAKTVKSMEQGLFDDEIAPVEVPGRKGSVTVVSKDEHPRAETTFESLGKLRPAFKKDGTVTAGNASGINDGAAAVIVASAEFAQQKGLKPLAVIRGYATTGLHPYYMGLGPVEASRKALAMAGVTLDQIDLIEFNEAFAAQSLAVARELGADADKINVNGGAIALGHPIGASGARILVTLLHEMARRDVKLGLASLCVGGGMGVAMVVERIS
ncbi:MAG: acetyl-CoA C-acyltransferase [Candidatus Wallbacteria bacterium HGW-Wallbacteria-1]|uniref:Acetyl-CoA C-acyltransferase n=1 Tax=Candidatus Wallbacteria bacterium HGW-Wallbacteria-1 TaxID=2013854 RepID=A0A2N1PQX4_9BACT|nr:MAG: acetyl-CoA C-acyltransferase [Candidatus Wallbacteria bacterium HGW-Wallbacteria-1]